MSKITTGLGGRGTVTTIERKKHPKSHFEMTGMNIKKSDDGSFVIEHRTQLKKKYDNNEMYMGSYREPETHTAKDADELISHVSSHLSKKAADKDGDE